MCGVVEGKGKRERSGGGWLNEADEVGFAGKTRSTRHAKAAPDIKRPGHVFCAHVRWWVVVAECRSLRLQRFGEGREASNGRGRRLTVSSHDASHHSPQHTPHPHPGQEERKAGGHARLPVIPSPPSSAAPHNPLINPTTSHTHSLLHRQFYHAQPLLAGRGVGCHHHDGRPRLYLSRLRLHPKRNDLAHLGLARRS